MSKNRFVFRITSVLLMLLMLTSALGCSVGGNGAVTTDVTTEGNETTEPVTEEKKYQAPDVYYDSSEYTILLTGNANDFPNPFAYSDTQLVLDNAVYMRNVAVEEELGIVFNIIYEPKANNSGNGPGTARLKADHAANESNYDSCLISAYDLGNLAQLGYLADLNENEHMDLSMSYWDQNACDQMEIDGKLYFTTGDISFNDKEYTFAVIFNKKIAAEKQLGNLYSMVENGSWTFDKFAEMCRTVSEDLNGDDILDSRDKYGLELWDDTLLPMITAAGQKVITVNDEGIPELTLNTETSANIIEKFISLAGESCSINFQHMSGGVSWMNMYINGQALFLLEYFKALPLFRDTELDYGILPFPKYNEQQEGYFSGMSAWHVSFYCIPKLSDAEKSGYVSESLAYHSERLVTPAYYERNLIGRQIKDTESGDMLDIIFDNRTFDLGFYYRIGELNTVLLNMLRNNNPAFASQYEANRARTELALKEMKYNFGIE